MGNSKSRIINGTREKKYGKDGSSRHPANNNRSTDRRDEHEDVELLLMRRMIQKDPEIFVLNNLMMCIQFFRNYEEEIDHVKKTLVSSREAELNKRLPPQKHVLLPDVLQEHIARNVGFSSTRQTLRPTIEPLQSVRIYTVHDNIDITEQNYSTHYSIVNDSMMYNILLKPTEHQGYVQLQLLDESRNKARSAEYLDLTSIAENDDELYSDMESIYVSKPRSHLFPLKQYHQGTLKGCKYGHARSLPNLHNEGNLSETERVISGSICNGKPKSECESGSSNKRTWSKGECRRCEMQTSATKLHGFSSHSRTSSVSSGYRSCNCTTIDSDHSCKLCQSLRLGKNLNDEEINEKFITDAKLPERSFKRVIYTAEGKVYDPREERKQLLNSKQRRIKLALRRHNYDLFYVSSTEFMKHFINIFAHCLADSFGFNEESVEDARREGCVLYCDKVMISSSFKLSRVEQYEIIPAIWLQWPICAQEWLDRPRSTWPDYNDVEKMKDFGCYVVPEGFVPKRGSSNLMEDLEWQLTFPTAERYLETCMTQAQVQVYLIALMLHKTFMRPVFDTMFGLTAAHIRHKLFWLIEQEDRPAKWPDNRAGECLLKLLNSLYHGISQNEPTLRDYFVRDRNLFQRVPSDHLLHTQKQLKRIIENPVMYVFHAMENILYSENFFPRLDYELLLRILTVDTLTLVNPALVQHIPRPIPRDKHREDCCSQEERYGRIGFWDSVRQQDKKYSMQSVTNKTLINPRKATDSIIEISIRCAELDDQRSSALLDFFIRHFIKIAERCHQYRGHRQKSVYLDHADRLSILLSEHQRFKEDARAYRDKIKILRKKKTAESRTPGDPPETPKRNAEADAIFVAPLKERFARSSPEQVSSDAEIESPCQSDQNVRHPVTRVMVHETQCRESAAEASVKTVRTDRTHTLTSQADECQQVITLSIPSTSLANESTYI